MYSLKIRKVMYGIQTSLFMIVIVCVVSSAFHVSPLPTDSCCSVSETVQYSISKINTPESTDDHIDVSEGYYEISLGEDNTRDHKLASSIDHELTGANPTNKVEGFKPHVDSKNGAWFLVKKTPCARLTGDHKIDAFIKEYVVVEMNTIEALRYKRYDQALKHALELREVETEWFHESPVYCMEYPGLLSLAYECSGMYAEAIRLLETGPSKTRQDQWLYDLARIKYKYFKETGNDEIGNSAFVIYCRIARYALEKIDQLELSQTNRIESTDEQKELTNKAILEILTTVQEGVMMNNDPFLNPEVCPFDSWQDFLTFLSDQLAFVKNQKAYEDAVMVYLSVENPNLLHNTLEEDYDRLRQARNNPALWSEFIRNFHFRKILWPLRYRDK